MSGMFLDGVTDEWIGPLTFELEPGVHVLTGDPAPLGRLVQLLGGVRKPRRGRIGLRAQNAANRPLSARVATLQPEEELLPARSVEAAVDGVIRLRGLSPKARELLDRAGLGELAARRPNRLEHVERRAIMLALALADERAEALVLYDPLSATPLLTKSFVLDGCLQHAKHKLVLVASPHLEDALVLGGKLLTFARGAVFSMPAQRASGASVSVRSRHARRLAGLLADEPGILGVSYDAERAPFEVVAKSLDPEALAEAVVRLASDNEISITGLFVSAQPVVAGPPNLAGMPVASAPNPFAGGRV